MPEWVDQAIILRYGHFREADLWLRVLLREHGLLTLFAFGGARSRRRFCGCLDQLNTIQCQIRPSRGNEYLSLEEASLLVSPVQLRKDWRRMGIAANCMRFVEACGLGPETARDSFELIGQTRDALETGDPVPRLFPIYFRLKLATILGFAPDFGTCGQCGAPLGAWSYFLVEEGQPLCPACSHGHIPGHRHRGILLADGVLDLLKNVQQNTPRFWPAAGTDEDLRLAARAIDAFVQFHLGLAWDNGNFRRI